MSSRGARHWALRTATLVVAAIAVLSAAPPAWSHSELDRSDPAQGGMVAPGRTVLRLWFGEPVSLRASGFELAAGDGTRLAVRSSLGADDRTVLLRTDPLPTGSYTLEWRALSTEDGHLSTGSLAFGAGLRPAVVPDGGASLPPLAVTVLRWLDLVGMLVAIGALAVSGRVLGALGQVGQRPRRRARTIGATAALVSAYAALVTPFVRTHASGTPTGAWLRETWATLVETSWGHVWLARDVTALLAALLVWWWSRRGGAPAALGRLALALLSVSALLEALAGHASSLPRLSSAAALVSAAHVVAAGVWAGGLGVLVLCLVPMMRRTPEVRGVVLSSVWRTFSPMAAVASVVLLATGLYEAGRHVPDLASLAASVYGGAVAAKTLLLALALAMAGLNLLMIRPGRSPVSRSRFTTTVTVEALLLLAAVVLAAVLTTTPTAREVDGAARSSALRTVSIDGLFVSLEHVASGPGRSHLVARVRPTVLPPPAPVVGVDVSLTAPGGAMDHVHLARVEEGRFEGSARSSTPGHWSATLAVHRRGLTDAVTRITWTTEPPSGSRSTPLEVSGTVAAVVLLLGLLVVIARTRRRPEQRRTTESPVAQPEEMSLP